MPASYLLHDYDILSILILFVCFTQKQADRIKREKGQARRGDDVEPQVQPSLVAVGRFHGSRLASGPSPSPYEQSGVGKAMSRFSGMKIKHKQSLESDGSGSPGRLNKVARLSSGASIGSAIVEAENTLEIDVCFHASGETLLHQPFLGLFYG